MADQQPKPIVVRGKLTLAALVGAGVATALGYFIPQMESGRIVEATLNADQTLNVKHVSGRQYLDVYLDVVGVATACDGITTYKGKPLPQDHTFTEAECSEMLEEELIKHATGMLDCTPTLEVSAVPAVERAREGPRFAATSVAYNIGVARYCRSTARRRFVAYDYDGGCEALTWYNKAGGRVYSGLVKRRDREYKVCINGLEALYQ